MIRSIIALCLLVLASACTQLPKVELQSYRDAFQATQAAAQPIIADYAVAERAQRLRLLKSDSSGRQWTDDTPYFATFSPGDTAAVSTIGLPPGADAVDRSLRAIAAYNDTLVALAENRNIDEAKGQLRQIVADVGAIVPVGAPRLALAGTLSDLVVNIFSPAIEAGNRELFREKVLQGYEPMLGLLDQLIEHSSTQYSTTISPLRIKVQEGAANKSELIDKINAWHQVYADYVVLLQGSKERLTELKLAVENPRSAPLLARASAGSAELRAYAEGLRRSIDELRATP
jgi:hypothetical protein